MATLTWRISGSSRNRLAISKSITTIGSDKGNDVVLPTDAGISSHHAQVVFDGQDFGISAVDSGCRFLLNGKDRKKSKLCHGDQVQIGGIDLQFSILALPDAEKESSSNGVIEGFRLLQSFSAKLMSHEHLPGILDELMDSVIELTGASKGFLVLVEDGLPVIKVARNIRRENLANAIAQMSDSIVARVIETQKALIVFDAMNDTQFSSAESVINLRLNAVMCAPMAERGRLLGLIYVGSDRIAGLFDQPMLDLLSMFAAQASILVQNALLLDALRVENQCLTAELKKERFGEIVGDSPVMQDVFRRVEKVASADISVLIGGETGTGKELIAKEIHRRSPRAGGPFVSVNCGAIPENLMESEFFGHMKGAFTGAFSTRAGKFQAADGGTLFLDEIGEMPLSLQVKILRVLQERQIVKVGATKPEDVDIRIVTATNRNLEDEVAAGRFREDLYYRLNVVHIDLPPLRNRDSDILLLAKYLLNRYTVEYGGHVKGFTPGALNAIKRHNWPGNVRELENKLKKAVILCEGTMIGPQDLDLEENVLPTVLSLADAKEKFQRDYILQVLAQNSGNRTKTAKDLDVDPRTIYRYLEKA